MALPFITEQWPGSMLSVLVTWRCDGPKMTIELA